VLASRMMRTDAGAADEARTSDPRLSILLSVWHDRNLQQNHTRLISPSAL
jgi:hypothetical protein